MSKALDLVIERNKKDIDAAVSSMNVFRQQIEKAASHLETLVNYRHQCQQTIQDKASSTGLRARELLNQHSFITQVDKAIAQQVNHSRACEVFFNEAKSKVQAEVRQGLKFKTAKLVIAKKQAIKQSRKEQKAADEIASNLISKARNNDE